MKVLKSKTLKGFMMGILFTLVVSIGIGGVYAKSQSMSISVLMGGIKVYVDDHLQVFKDVNGRTVEPMIYNGTTYLPVRGVASAVGKEVHWDQATMTVSLGKKAVVGQVDIADVKMHHRTAYGSLIVGEGANFTKLDKKVTAFNRFSNYSQYSYILDSKYSALKAKLDTPYSQIGSTEGGLVTFYSVDRYGTETEIASYETKAGDDTIHIHVDLHGVNILKIETGLREALYDVTLAGLK